jgi:hypothetical protein
MVIGNLFLQKFKNLVPLAIAMSFSKNLQNVLISGEKRFWSMSEGFKMI